MQYPLLTTKDMDSETDVSANFTVENDRKDQEKEREDDIRHKPQI